MNESWAKTQSRLKKWQRENPTAWDLRRALSDSEHFSFIAKSAARRATNRPENVTWQDWWAFYLERLTEKQAVALLLEVWNKDVWAHLQHEIRSQAQDILSDMAERARLKIQFTSAFDQLLDQSRQRLLSAPSPTDAPEGGSSASS